MNLKFEQLSQVRLKEALSLIKLVFPDYFDRVEKVYNVSLENNKTDEYWKTRRILEYWTAVDLDTNKIVALTGFYQKTKHSEDEIWLGWFTVIPEARGKGVGRQVLEWTINEARNKGYKFFRLWTTTDPDEAVAQKLYGSLGINIYKKEFDEKSGDTILYRELKL